MDSQKPQSTPKELVKVERGNMKKQLLNWGGSLDLCKRKQDEIRKINRILEDGRNLLIEIPLENGTYEVCNVSIDKMTKIYEKEIQRIQTCMEQRLKEKRHMDELIDNLECDEQEFLYLRYRKGFGYDYISLKIHMSRAQCFRVHDRALDKLIIFEKENRG